MEGKFVRKNVSVGVTVIKLMVYSKKQPTLASSQSYFLSKRIYGKFLTSTLIIDFTQRAISLAKKGRNKRPFFIQVSFSGAIIEKISTFEMLFFLLF